MLLAVFMLTSHSKVGRRHPPADRRAGFATVPPLQKWVIDQAAGAPTLASSANIGAFNLGNAVAAWLGGLVIAAGLGYSAPNAAGAVMAAGALAVAVLSGRLERRTGAGQDTGPGSLSGSRSPSADPVSGGGAARQAAHRRDGRDPGRDEHPDDAHRHQRGVHAVRRGGQPRPARCRAGSSRRW